MKPQPVDNFAEREFPFSEKEFRFLANFAREQTGIVLSEQKKDMVYSRVVRRLRALNLKSFSQYCELIKNNDSHDEIANLVNVITTNLTSFFREPHHFDHLRDEVLSPLNSKPPSDKRLRIWSAACSAGMEPYSIAMTIKSAVKNLDKWDARILATDIDTNMLNKGKIGEYVADQYEKIPSNYHTHVTKVKNDELIHMSDPIKSLITFKPLNLLEPWPMKGPFDAVFCRNVVIYFDKETQSKLFSSIADLIKPDGWLYIGHSESLHNVCDRFELVGRTIYKKVR